MLESATALASNNFFIVFISLSIVLCDCAGEARTADNSCASSV
jgi:hypothetical protein